MGQSLVLVGEPNIIDLVCKRRLGQGALVTTQFLLYYIIFFIVLLRYETRK